VKQTGVGGVCIDGDTAFDFACGRLSPEHVAALDEHVDRCADCRFVVAEAVRGLREHSTAPRAQGAPITRLIPGVLLANRYRITRFIARGGMGEVYEASDLMLGERIALKTLVATIADDARAVERLKFEANFSRKITHPNVCRIFDIGVHEQPGARGPERIFFITMELVPGVSLGETLRTQGAMSTERARPLVEGMVAALSAAHRVGVVHRDFKSDNVMVSAQPLRVVVMDFGLARAFGAGALAGSSHDGQALVGTVAYMAPEQLQGRPVSPATDIYALGVVMFEMVTGRLPFAGHTGIEGVARRLVEPAPAPRDLVPSLDPRWDDVIRRCSEREPSARFARVEDVAQALAAASRMVAPGTNVSRLSRRALLTGSAGVVAAGGLAAWGLRRPDPPALVAPRPASGGAGSPPPVAVTTPGPAGAPMAAPSPASPVRRRQPGGARARPAPGTRRPEKRPGTTEGMNVIRAGAAAPGGEPVPVASPKPLSEHPEDGLIVP
jgi:hypothetical protein